MARTLFSFLRDRSGITGVEYGVMAFFISVVLIAVARSVGSHLAATLLQATGFVTAGQSHTS